jgi:hypothetical protein
MLYRKEINKEFEVRCVRGRARPPYSAMLVAQPMDIDPKVALIDPPAAVFSAVNLVCSLVFMAVQGGSAAARKLALLSARMTVPPPPPCTARRLPPSR